MKTGRPRAPIVLTGAQLRILRAWQSGSDEHGLASLTPSERQVVARRASIVLASADGEANNAIAHRLHVAIRAVQKWRTRFMQLGHRGLLGTLRSGYAYPDEIDERIAHEADARAKSTYAIAREVGVSQMTVVRRLRKARSKP